MSMHWAALLTDAVADNSLPIDRTGLAVVMRTKVVSPATDRFRGRPHLLGQFRNKFTSITIEVNLLLS